ncbi:androgen-induced gene 1 protein-like isoform X2 [Arctopsyche grandis]|uniref:androgen-induced gene 1 protein-like isoform X2 n=1 Tax=Arctopsyche grandis TaxID=121162 RepID=UPI00406D93B0
MTEKPYALIHASILGVTVFGIWYDYVYVVFPREIAPEGQWKLPWKGRSKFLTMWNLVLQTIYFFIALLNDFIGSNENVPAKVPLIRKVKDYIFSSLAFPAAMYVGVTFWGLMAIDRELVFPKVLDEFFPTWLNHLMHTNIMIFIFLEMFLTYRPYPKRKRGILGMTLFLVTYLIWMHVIYFYSGLWVYPILQVLNWPLRIVFYLVSLVFGIAFYMLGEFSNNKLWSKQISQSKRSGRKKTN